VETMAETAGGRRVDAEGLKNVMAAAGHQAARADIGTAHFCF